MAATYSSMIRRGNFKVLILITIAVLLPTSFFVRHATPRRPGIRLDTQQLPVFSCPSPHANLPPIDHAQQVCVSVPSAISAFQLEMCHTPSTCNAFTLRVRRVDPDECRRALAAQDPSEDKALNEWVKKQLGPDGFMLRTDGTERIVSEMSVHEGDCSYRLDVRLRNTGQVFVEAWWTYENYVGYSETNTTWPEMLLHPLFVNPVELPPCPSRCTPVPPKPLMPSRTYFTFPNASTSVSPAALPACSGREPIRGSYFPAHPLDILYPPFYLPAPGGKPVVGRYQFVPHSCEWKHAGRRFTDVRKCTETKKHVLVMGDSHGRVVFDTMLHRLQGNQDILTVSEKQGSKSGAAGNLDINFLWDPRGLEYFPSGICEMFQDNPVDAFIMTMGAHHSGEATTAAFMAQVTMVLQSVKSCATSTTPPIRTPSHLVFLTQPAQPPRQDHWIRGNEDHRTNRRQQHWGALAGAVALENGWSLVDQFALTAPHVWEPLNLDMAHYLGTDAMDPILDEVIDKLGLCPDV